MSNIALTEGGTVSHSLRQYAPVEAGIGANMVNNGDGKGKAGAIIWMKGNGKETIFNINDYFAKFFRDRYWGRQARLQGPHSDHSLIDCSEIL